jgi:hypothetical protein
MTDVLYKYRSLATQDARTHTLDILDKLRLYCPAPASLNDPFECQAAISRDAPTDIKNERAKEQLIKENPRLSEMEARRLAPQKWQQVDQNGDTEFRRWLQNDVGVISFSICNDDHLMWSHYAGGHNGVCIEFRLAHKSHIDFFSNVHEVHYEDQLPTVNFYAPPSPEKVNALIFTKAKHWSYEQEWRMVVPDAKRRSWFVDLPPGIVSAVYLGCQISPENQRDILALLTSRPSLKQVRVYQAKRRPLAYALTFCSLIEAAPVG